MRSCGVGGFSAGKMYVSEIGVIVRMVFANICAHCPTIKYTDVRVPMKTAKLNSSKPVFPCKKRNPRPVICFCNFIS